MTVILRRHVVAFLSHGVKFPMVWSMKCSVAAVLPITMPTDRQAWGWLQSHFAILI